MLDEKPNCDTPQYPSVAKCFPIAMCMYVSSMGYPKCPCVVSNDATSKNNISTKYKRSENQNVEMPLSLSIGD